MRYLGVLVTVFRQPVYLLLAVAIAVVVFTGAVWLPSIPLILVVFQNASLSELFALLWSLYGTIGSNFSASSATYTIMIAILFGMNVSLLMYYIRRMRTGSSNLKGAGAASVGGLVSGVFGIGCAACGTFILTSVLTLFGVAGILAYLPFGGEEFGFLGVALLIYSVYSLTKKINDPLVCSI